MGKCSSALINECIAKLSLASAEKKSRCKKSIIKQSKPTGHRSEKEREYYRNRYKDKKIGDRKRMQSAMYYEANREECRKRQNERYANNEEFRERVKKRSAAYKELHKEHYKELSKMWKEKNRERYKEYMREYQRKRKERNNGTTIKSRGGEVRKVN